MSDRNSPGQRNKQELSASDSDQCRLPTQAELNHVAQLDVLDACGNPSKFISLWNRQERTQRRNIIVFIRHFFCGSCEEFVRSLSTDISPAGLQSRNPPTTLTIIGCGEYSLIPGYISRTGCKFEVYTDPSRAIYSALGMTCSLSFGDTKPEYIRKSFLGTVASSVSRTLGSLTADPGKKSQNGGEFIWIDGEISWARRMRHTRDHTEIDDLRRVLDDQSEPSSPDGKCAEPVADAVE